MKIFSQFIIVETCFGLMYIEDFFPCVIIFSTTIQDQECKEGIENKEEVTDKTNTSQVFLQEVWPIASSAQLT